MNKLTYFISRFSMFGIGSFLLLQNSGKDAWISLLLGTILGIIVIYIYSLIKKLLNEKTLGDTLRNYPLGKLFIFILILFYVYLIIIVLTILTMFVNSFYLVYTPKIFVTIPFLLIAVYLTFKGKKVLESLSTLFFWIGIPTILIFALFLSKSVDISYLYPIMSYKTTSILKSSLIFASITSIPQIISIDFMKDFKQILKDYLIGCTSLFFVLFFTIICLGEPLLKIYSFPEYSVLKQIKVLKFIENIENISAFIWYFDLFITLSTITYNLKNTLIKKYNLVKFYLLIFIGFIISTFIINKNYRYIITSFYTYPYVLIGFFVVFFLIYIYLKIKKVTKPTN